jgi:hypothetical protein
LFVGFADDSWDQKCRREKIRHRQLMYRDCRQAFELPGDKFILIKLRSRVSFFPRLKLRLREEFFAGVRQKRSRFPPGLLFEQPGA